MADVGSTKLNAEQHLLLDHPMLRLPYELLRKNFKNAQRYIEREQSHVTKELNSTANGAGREAAATGDASATLAQLDSVINRMQGLKRKLEALHEEDTAIQKATRARLEHLDELYSIPDLVDVKYDKWSKVRLNRLLVDYLLRSGYCDSAKALAVEQGIEDLVDLDAFVQCERIAESLRNGRCQDALNWCGENKQGLKRVEGNLEFELRLQQYVELVRSGSAQKLQEATLHARKYLTSHSDTAIAIRAAGLLAFPASTPAEPYKTLYSPERWARLAELFITTHNSLYLLPPNPLLHIALSAGLSALKTPTCHSQMISYTECRMVSTSVCPICSTELNELARNLPYAHHSKSFVENDLVVLPTGRVYGRERLMELNAMIGVPRGVLKDPMQPDHTYSENQLKRVYIS